MRRHLLAWLIAGAALPLVAADRPVWRSVELEDVVFNVRLVRDLRDITRLLGSDLDKEYILLELDVKPLYNATVQLSRDDFVLRSYRYGDRSFAQSPDRIAGEAVLVLTEGRARSGGGGGSEIETRVSAETQEETTLIGRLKQLELAMGPTRTQVRGYLYFQLNPKNKPKHLAFMYDGSAGQCKIPFK